MNLKETRCDGVDWIELSHDLIQWRNILISIVQLWFFDKCQVITRTKLGEQLSATEE